MDADNVILLAKCLSNKAFLVCNFALGYLGQDRGQRSLSAKRAKILSTALAKNHAKPAKGDTSHVTKMNLFCFSQLIMS